MSWRNTRAYRKWRAAIIRRDKRCVLCSTVKKRQAHHIDSALYFPDKRYDVDNGVVLCWSCHRHLHTSFKSSYRKKTTRADWLNYMDLAKYFLGKGSNGIPKGK